MRNTKILVFLIALFVSTNCWAGPGTTCPPSAAAIAEFNALRAEIAAQQAFINRQATRLENLCGTLSNAIKNADLATRGAACAYADEIARLKNQATRLRNSLSLAESELHRLLNTISDLARRMKGCGIGFGTPLWRVIGNFANPAFVSNFLRGATAVIGRVGNILRPLLSAAQRVISSAPASCLLKGAGRVAGSCMFGGLAELLLNPGTASAAEVVSPDTALQNWLNQCDHEGLRSICWARIQNLINSLNAVLQEQARLAEIKCKKEALRKTIPEFNRLQQAGCQMVIGDDDDPFGLGLPSPQALLAELEAQETQSEQRMYTLAQELRQAHDRVLANNCVGSPLGGGQAYPDGQISTPPLQPEPEPDNILNVACLSTRSEAATGLAELLTRASSLVRNTDPRLSPEAQAKFCEKLVTENIKEMLDCQETQIFCPVPPFGTGANIPTIAPFSTNCSAIPLFSESTEKKVLGEVEMPTLAPSPTPPPYRPMVVDSQCVLQCGNIPGVLNLAIASRRELPEMRSCYPATYYGSDIPASENPEALESQAPVPLEFGDSSSSAKDQADETSQPNLPKVEFACRDGITALVPCLPPVPATPTETPEADESQGEAESM